MFNNFHDSIISSAKLIVNDPNFPEDSQQKLIARRLVDDKDFRVSFMTTVVYLLHNDPILTFLVARNITYLDKLYNEMRNQN